LLVIVVFIFFGFCCRFSVVFIFFSLVFMCFNDSFGFPLIFFIVHSCFFSFLGFIFQPCFQIVQRKTQHSIRKGWHVKTNKFCLPSSVSTWDAATARNELNDLGFHLSQKTGTNKIARQIKQCATKIRQTQFSNFQKINRLK
jgi:hypothetical protein